LRRLLNLLPPTHGKDRHIKNLAWSEHLSAGNVIIDAEHCDLMRIANEAIRAIESSDCLILLQELGHLDERLYAHCAHEETLAQSVGFPLDLLRTAQQYSRAALRHLMGEMESKYGPFPDKTAAYFAHLLSAWVNGRGHADEAFAAKAGLQLLARLHRRIGLYPGHRTGVEIICHRILTRRKSQAMPGFIFLSQFFFNMGHHIRKLAWA
jgi:hemerythrin